MFDEYCLELYDREWTCYGIRSDFDLLSLMRFIPFGVDGHWRIYRGHLIEGLFFPTRMISRSADV